MKKAPIGKATEEEIAAWKKEHGEIFAYETEDGSHVAYFKHADRNVLALASSKMKSSIVSYSEVMFDNCFIGGAKEIRTDDKLFYGFHELCDELFAKKKGTLKSV